MLPVAALPLAVAVPDFPPPLPLPLPPVGVVFALPPPPAAALATAVSNTDPRLQTKLVPLTGAVKLPGKFDRLCVPFCGRAFGSTQVELSVQPGEVKPSSLVQSIELREAAQPAIWDTGMRLLKKVN